MRNAALVTAMSIVIFYATFGYSNYGDTYGVSGTGIARGNALCAIVSDWSSVYYNVAGLGRTRINIQENRDGFNIEIRDEDLSTKMMNKKTGTPEVSPVREPLNYNDQLAISYLYTMPKIKIDIQSSVTADRELDFGMITIGIVMDLNHIYGMPEFISSARFGLSFGISQDLNLVRINDLDPMHHQFFRYGKKAARSVILGGFGFGFFDDLFGIGVGVNVLFGGKGYMMLSKINGTNPDSQMPEQDLQLDFGISAGLTGGIYVDFGKIASLLEGLNLGFSYRGEVELSAPIDVDASIEAPAANYKLVVKLTDFYTPHILTAGLAYSLPFFPLTISVDVDCQMWSRYRFKMVRIIYNESPKFTDIIVPRIGFLFQIIDSIAFTAGYSYRSTFVPDNALTGDVNTLDGDTHIASAGFIFNIPKMGDMGGPVRFSIAYQLQIMPDRQVTKNPGQLEYGPALNPDYSFGGMVHSFACEVVFSW